MKWIDLETRCYAPYSGLKDFCMVKGSSGVLHPGVRVENISFPLSIGAAQAAIFSCLSEGDTPGALLFPDKIETKDHTRKTSSCSEKELLYWCDEFGLKCNTSSHPVSGTDERFFQTNEQNADIVRLRELTDRCIIPYSAFPVTALLVTDAGIFSGVNIEVDDWQKGLCAERVAIAKARASGAASFQEIHVYAPQSDYVSPCGACRQVLVEHMGDGVMYMHHNDVETSRLTVADLLPYQFKAGSLGHKQH